MKTQLVKTYGFAHDVTSIGLDYPPIFNEPHIMAYLTIYIENFRSPSIIPLFWIPLPPYLGL